MSAVEVLAFDIADKVDGELLEQRSRFAGEFVALMFLLADRQDTDAGIFPVTDDTGVGRAHDGEVGQHFRCTVHVRTNIDQDGQGSLQGGEDLCDSRSMDTGEDAHDNLRYGHCGAGVPGRNQSLGMTVAH